MTYWTLEVTEAIHISIPAMNAYWDKCNFQISKIVDLVRGELSLQNRITLGEWGFVVTSVVVAIFKI